MVKLRSFSLFKKSVEKLLISARAELKLSSNSQWFLYSTESRRLPLRKFQGWRPEETRTFPEPIFFFSAACKVVLALVSKAGLTRGGELQS
jgi:hypothetical protein